MMPVLLAPATLATYPATRTTAAIPSGRHAPAELTTPDIDRISVTAARGMTRATIVAVEQAAIEVGAQTTIVQQGTIDLLGVSRPRAGAADLQVQLAPPGMAIPMSTIAVDPTVIGQTMPPEVASTLVAGNLVMSDISASLRGARVGDVATFVGWDGVRHALAIGLIAPESAVGGAEMVMSTTAAASFGFVRPSSIRVWAFSDRAVIDAALARRLRPFTGVRVRHSWDGASADDPVSQGRAKQLLGEFALARTRRGTFTEQASWVTANIVTRRLPILGTMRCHKVVLDAAAAALAEVEARGLSWAINVADTRRYGGCWNARELRTDTGTSGRNLSRHAFGAAIDVNPSTNRFGGKANIDPTVVQIFRKHGFAWGGSFIIPDPMHFEYVGEARA